MKPTGGTNLKANDMGRERTTRPIRGKERTMAADCRPAVFTSFHFIAKSGLSRTVNQY
jgi:hypothetical protein